VTRRKGELARLLAVKKVEAIRAMQRAEDTLVAFAERARPIAEQAGSRAVDGVRAAEELMRGRDGALAGEMDAHRAELIRIDQQLGSIEHELAAARAEEKRIDEELAAAVEVKKRAEAKLRRADIEIRNATQLLEGKKGAVS
jgi:chromosome segregation ATPase